VHESVENSVDWLIDYQERAGETERLSPPLALIGRGVRACGCAVTALGLGTAFRTRTLMGFKPLELSSPKASSTLSIRIGFAQLAHLCVHMYACLCITLTAHHSFQQDSLSFRG
jgi:hypothetical protein